MYLHLFLFFLVSVLHGSRSVIKEVSCYGTEIHLFPPTHLSSPSHTAESLRLKGSGHPVWFEAIRSNGHCGMWTDDSKKWNQKSALFHNVPAEKLLILLLAPKMGIFVLMCHMYLVKYSTHLWWEKPLTQVKSAHTHTHTHTHIKFTLSGRVFVILYHSCESKVGYFTQQALWHQDVCRSEVSVNIILLLYVRHALCYLQERIVLYEKNNK